MGSGRVDINLSALSSPETHREPAVGVWLGLGDGDVPLRLRAKSQSLTRSCIFHACTGSTCLHSQGNVAYPTPCHSDPHNEQHPTRYKFPPPPHPATRNHICRHSRRSTRTRRRRHRRTRPHIPRTRTNARRPRPRHARTHSHNRLRCHKPIALAHEPVEKARHPGRRRRPRLGAITAKLPVAKTARLLTDALVCEVGRLIASAVDGLGA